MSAGAALAGGLTRAWVSLKDWLAGWRGWELNPVVVKELRQAVRSWAVVGMLMFFLVILFCTGAYFLASQVMEVNTDLRLGEQIFGVFAAILTTASLVFIPLYIGVRLAVERQESNLDLLYITTLTPSKIIWGKFLCGVYLIVLFFSACMPFMAFTNLMRGIDLPTIGFLLVYLFVLVCLAIQLAIFVACLPVSKFMKLLVALVTVFSLFPVITGITFSYFSLMSSGVGSLVFTGSLWRGIGLSALGLTLAAGLLHVLSVAMISPLSANRAVPIRAYLTLLWLAGGAITGWEVYLTRRVDMIMPWCVLSLLGAAAALVVVVSNQDQLSLRVRRNIPRRRWLRVPAFLFYNGAAGGLVWISLLAFATLLIAAAVIIEAGRLPHFRGYDPAYANEFVELTLAAILYFLAYGLTALYIQRRFFPRRPSKLAGVLTVLLPALWAVIPNLVLFFQDRLTFNAVEQTQLGNVFNAFMVREAGQRSAHIYFSATWAALVLLLNLPWFIRQVKAFIPPERARPTIESPPAAPGLPPRIHSQAAAP